MPAITALLHTDNDALRLGRALETLRPCDELLVVDHASRDATLHVAREYGARILPFRPGATPAHYLQAAEHDWILCLEPRESLTESLEASLFEWKSELSSGVVPARATGSAFSVFLREQRPDGWLSLPSPQIRLIPRSWNHWNGHLPANQPSVVTLEGELLRFLFP